MRFLIVALLLIIGIQLAAGAASQCYNCLVTGCGDPFDANSGSVTKAPSINGWCLKVKGEKDGVSAVDRLPDPGACSSNKCEKQTTQGVTGVTCCCNTDLCNASPRSASTIGINLIIGLVLLSFFARFY